MPLVSFLTAPSKASLAATQTASSVSFTAAQRASLGARTSSVLLSQPPPTRAVAPVRAAIPPQATTQTARVASEPSQPPGLLSQTTSAGRSSQWEKWERYDAAAAEAGAADGAISAEMWLAAAPESSAPTVSLDGLRGLNHTAVMRAVVAAREAARAPSAAARGTDQAPAAEPRGGGGGGSSGPGTRGGRGRGGRGRAGKRGRGSKRVSEALDIAALQSGAPQAAPAKKGKRQQVRVGSAACLTAAAAQDADAPIVYSAVNMNPQALFDRVRSQAAARQAVESRHASRGLLDEAVALDDEFVLLASPPPPPPPPPQTQSQSPPSRTPLVTIANAPFAAGPDAAAAPREPRVVRRSVSKAL
jgi:hypothetical protein